MNPLAWWERKRHEQHKAREMPPWIRRRIYNELLAVMEEEAKMKQLLDLPVAPRLSVVDEQQLVVLHPRHREEHGLDKIMHRVIREREKKKQKDNTL